MLRAVVFAVIASAALPLGAAIGAWWTPSRRVTAMLLAFASGALITAIASELFGEAFEGGRWQAAAAFLGGATVFVVADAALERRQSGGAASGSAVGFALLLGVTLDGVPENLAMGVSLITGGGVVLLVAIFASNLPEAIVGAEKMREAGLAPGRVLRIWSIAAVLLAVPVLVGYAALEGVSDKTLAWPLGFAAGAVLASLADTLMPEAFDEGGPGIAYATALGFLLSFALSAV